MTRRKPASGIDRLLVFLGDPRLWMAISTALAGGVGVTVHESGEKRDGGFREGFYACQEGARENRDAGMKKIIPKFREELLEEEPNVPAVGQ